MSRKRKKTKNYYFHHSSSADNKALSYSIVCAWLNSKNETTEFPFEKSVLVDAKNQSIAVGDWATTEKILEHLTEGKEKNETLVRHRRATMPYALPALIKQINIGEILSIGSKDKF